MGLIGELLDLVLPQSCAGCAAAPGLLCPDCAGRLTGPPRVAWPAPVPSGLPRPWAVVAYEGPVRAMLNAYKESGRTGLARPLGAALAHAALSALGEGRAAASPGSRRPAGPAPVLLVPVPSARAAVRRRGHDPIHGMAVAAVAELRRHGVPARVLGVLTQRRKVADQAGLTAAGRMRNLAEALALDRRRARREDRRGGGFSGPVIVVDDVITTGATLAEAARVLRAAGAHVPGAAVVAATRRRTGPSPDSHE